MRRTFVIGDVHGQLDRLRTLLKAAGITNGPHGLEAEGKPIEVVQLGDLADCRLMQTGDEDCYAFALKMGFTVLWGNHDRAALDPTHSFNGYYPASNKLLRLIGEIGPKWAVARHGWLLTHAGLTSAFALNGTVEELSEWIENVADDSPAKAWIGRARGGNDPCSGVLWRDASKEPLLNVPQVFGHTRGYVRYYHEKSVCIDVAGKNDDNQAGIWLPDFRVVAVGRDADVNRIGEQA